MAFAQRDPFSWAESYMNTQSSAAARESAQAQNALMQIFEAETRRQTPFSDLPVDLAKQNNASRNALNNSLALAEGKEVLQRRYGEFKMPTDGLALGATLTEQLSGDLGIPLEAAAGLVGNLAAETGDFKHMQELKPLIPGSRGGYGWAQWTGPRRKEFEAWAAQQGLDVSSPEANRGFLVYEMRTKYPKVLERLKRARTPDEAAIIVQDHYLKPGIPNTPGRLSRARKIYEQVNTTRNKRVVADTEYDRKAARRKSNNENPTIADLKQTFEAPDGEEVEITD